MNKEWSLDILYQGFQDEQYKADKTRLMTITEEMEAFSAGLSEVKNEE
ncbi:MAG: hypothetical protein H6Q59_2352, partial [Firmicutes bacterium]|nr:hypothetical protein [Bacillota bacterium]